MMFSERFGHSNPSVRVPKVHQICDTLFRRIDAFGQNRTGIAWGDTRAQIQNWELSGIFKNIPPECYAQKNIQSDRIELKSWIYGVSSTL